VAARFVDREFARHVPRNPASSPRAVTSGDVGHPASEAHVHRSICAAASALQQSAPCRSPHIPGGCRPEAFCPPGRSTSFEWQRRDQSRARTVRTRKRTYYAHIELCRSWHFSDIGGLGVDHVCVVGADLVVELLGSMRQHPRPTVTARARATAWDWLRRGRASEFSGGPNLCCADREPFQRLD
jgi:hypothetical protein